MRKITKVHFNRNSRELVGSHYEYEVGHHHVVKIKKLWFRSPLYGVKVYFENGVAILQGDINRVEYEKGFWEKIKEQEGLDL